MITINWWQARADPHRLEGVHIHYKIYIFANECLWFRLIRTISVEPLLTVLCSMAKYFMIIYYIISKKLIFFTVFVIGKGKINSSHPSPPKPFIQIHSMSCLVSRWVRQDHDDSSYFSRSYRVWLLKSHDGSPQF